KPGNILLEDGEPIVADFGIARAVSEAVGDTSVDQGGVMTRPGVALGTPPYMSPEQASGEHEPTPRSDVYSLGCVLYEMLAGVPPFSAPTTAAVIAKHLHAAPPPLRTVRPQVPVHVEQAVARSLAKAPADRFQTAGELADALGGSDDISLVPRSRRTTLTRVGRRGFALGAI